MRSDKRVDGRAEIWSMGVVLYELIGGRAPFVADTIPELYALILDKTSRPAPLRSLRAEVPEALERVVERCLEKEAGALPGGVGAPATPPPPLRAAVRPASAARPPRRLAAPA